jgi:hypothetical protein
MVGRRNIVAYIILSLVTCGLFGLYWFVSLAGDIAKLREKADPRGLFDLIISFVTCGIWGLVCAYRYPKFIVEIQQKRGAPVNDLAVVSLILSLVGLGIVSWALMQNEINKIANAQ